MFQRSFLPMRRYLLDRMVLRPTRHPIEHPTQHRETFSFGKRKLECFVQRNFETGLEADLVVLKFPGTAGRAERSTGFPMSLMHEHRIEIWTWNPPGYGRSEGQASLPLIGDAALSFWDEVIERRGNREATKWLCGNSLGSVSALHVAAAIRPDPSSTGLILRNPPPLISVVNRVARSYPFGRLMEGVIDSLCESMNAMCTSTRAELPAVFLQSELDSLVPIEDQNQLIARYGGPRHVVMLEGLEHSCPTTDDHAPRIAESIGWLWEQTGQKHHVCKS